MWLDQSQYKCHPHKRKYRTLVLLAGTSQAGLSCYGNSTFRVHSHGPKTTVGSECEALN